MLLQWDDRERSAMYVKPKGRGESGWWNERETWSAFVRGHRLRKRDRPEKRGKVVNEAVQRLLMSYSEASSRPYARGRREGKGGKRRNERRD